MRRDLWTLYPLLKHRISPFRAPEPVAWSTQLEDADVGCVRLTGELREVEGASDVYVVCHGLGGSPDSYYCRRAAAAVASIGASSLCLSLRGSDRLGEDFYNIALRADLEAAVGSPELASYRRVFVIGYSMGGYVTLHYARDPDPRVRAVAAICTPLDLHAAQRYIDSPRAWPYRHWVLAGLKAIYAAVAARRPVPTDPAVVARVRSIYEWDRVAIAPRYGYDSPEHYYHELSIRPWIGKLAVPALHVAAAKDPVIPRHTIEPFLDGAAEPYELRWVQGRVGHVAFPADLDLGFGALPGLEAQLLAWFARHA